MGYRSGRRPSIKDVAAAAGVSTATVSNALAARDGQGRSAKMSPETMRRVIEATDALGYEPNHSARATRTGQTGIILLALRMIPDPWSLSVVKTVQAATESTGLTPLVLADGDWFATARKGVADVVFVDHAAGPADEEKLRRAVESGIRVVAFGETLEPAGYDVVRSHSRAGVRDLLDYLAEEGGPISCLGRRVTDEADDNGRVGWWREAVDRHGLDAKRSRLWLFDGTPADAYARSVEIFSQSSPPETLFVTSDYAALEALRAARTRGLVPGVDVRIAGVGNAPIDSEWAGRMTTVGPENFFEQLADFIVQAALDPASAGSRSIDFDWTVQKRDTA